ncbi:nuclease [Porphyrobacter sp. TH134]|uniref:thermonuclease family protein n=1 Tax=Porphyrobacter sp. TH134 TaxID=2067450 RepID=UPI000C7D5299|nr:thermonuclease family protein [Porphyrobacter sp. TH134]PLK22455.1 nuclease [Porphyrobacter sp. TH134]
MPRAHFRFILAAFATLSIPSFGAAQVIEGPAEVIDGDSLRVAGTEVRLFGLDAPEFSQPCYSNGSEVACGAMAKDVLAGMIGSSVLSCQPRDTDTFGRIVATCRTSGVDIGEALVEAGWAAAFRRYGDDYVAAELRARAARSGIWRWDFQMPEDYRASQQTDPQPRTAQASPRPAGRARRYEGNGQCLIKGNHSRRGDWIYHLPGMPYYDATRAEAYFCTEAEAQAAGYRRAIVR